MARPGTATGWLVLILGAALARPSAGQPVQVLHTFTRSPGSPTGGLLEAPDGSFYGVTETGILRLTASGQMTEVARLEGWPSGALVRASDGALYGTTSNGGVEAIGTLFRFDPATGAIRQVHAFGSMAEGASPMGGLVEVGGALYGHPFGPGRPGRFVLLANPSGHEAVVDVEFLRANGPPLTRTWLVRPQSRLTIWVDDVELPAGSGQRPLAHGSVSTAVRVTNGVPVIVERAMWWPGPETAADYWYEAHNAAGATATATSWAIGGAEIGGPDAARTYVLVANMAERDGTAVVRLLGGEGELTADPISLPAKSRTTVDLGATFPTAPPGSYGVLVRSAGLVPVPIVVERATYASPGGVLWAAGANAQAAPLP